MSRREDAQAKAARAFDLAAKGIAPTVIAERLGTTRQHVHEMIHHKKKRRAEISRETKVAEA
jgi:transcriptional regulator